MLPHSSAVKSVCSIVQPYPSRCGDALGQSIASTRVVMSTEVTGLAVSVVFTSLPSHSVLGSGSSPCAPVNRYADVDHVAVLALRDVHALVHDEFDGLAHGFAELLGRCFVGRLGHHHSEADHARQEEGPSSDDGAGLKDAHLPTATCERCVHVTSSGSVIALVCFECFCLAQRKRPEAPVREGRFTRIERP